MADLKQNKGFIKLLLQIHWKYDVTNRFNQIIYCLCILNILYELTGEQMFVARGNDIIGVEIFP